MNDILIKQTSSHSATSSPSPSLLLTLDENASKRSARAIIDLESYDIRATKAWTAEDATDQKKNKGWRDGDYTDRIVVLKNPW